MLIDLLGERAELCVVGDDDQSIYGWRGAEVDLILRFPERHPGAEVVRLEQNYRSTGHILGCANAIIRRNLGRFGKQLFSELGDGDKVMVVPTHDEVDESRLVVQRIENDIDKGVPPTEIAVFYRTHAQSRVLEDALHRAGVRYTIYGGLRFFDRKEIKDLLAYLRLLLNPASDVDLQRIINVPARGIGSTTVDRLTQHATERGLTLSEALDEAPAIGLGAAACRKIGAFQGLLAGLREAMADQDLGELATTVLEATGYRAMLAADGTDESRDRLENLQEFVGALEAFTEDDPEATLADYLEQVALVADADGDGESLAAVTLMTIHSAKGLEFQSVYLTGMEERVFPHARVIEDPAQMEEERRLAYVAVTRAKRHLTITWARQRRLYGQLQLGEPSRFIRELPPPHVLGPTPGASMAQRGPAPARPAREPSWDSDIVYDEPAAARPRVRATAAAAGDDDAVALYVGMRVRHGRYGEGELIAWDGAGQNLKLTLHFPGVGTKTILARFCEPA